MISKCKFLNLVPQERIPSGGQNQSTSQLYPQSIESQMIKIGFLIQLLKIILKNKFCRISYKKISINFNMRWILWYNWWINTTRSRVRVFWDKWMGTPGYQIGNSVWFKVSTKICNPENKIHNMECCNLYATNDNFSTSFNVKAFTFERNYAWFTKVLSSLCYCPFKCWISLFMVNVGCYLVKIWNYWCKYIF